MKKASREKKWGKTTLQKSIFSNSQDFNFETKQQTQPTGFSHLFSTIDFTKRNEKEIDISSKKYKTKTGIIKARFQIPSLSVTKAGFHNKATKNQLFKTQIMI